jgi:ABC-2 type transport system ATP-binding protein
VTIAIRASGVAKRFGPHTAISGLSFEVESGEVFGLLGPNGAGKTTTLRILAGIYTPDEGEAEVAGLSARTQPDALRAQVGLLTEQPGLYDRLTAEENLAFFAELYGVGPAEARPRLERWLKLLGLWDHRARRAGTLSKGMRQKLAIARAMIHEPPIVLLDEPTSGLDPESARTVRDAIAALGSEGRTLVLCSHNLFEVERLCRRVAILRPSPQGGRLVALREVSQLRSGKAGVIVDVKGEAAAWEPLVRGLGGVAASSAQGSVLEATFVDGEDPTPQLVTALAGAGAQICGVRSRTKAFEEVYLELMAEEGAA